MQEKVLILDFGSQYTQLIARRVRELFIYCEIYPYQKIPNDLNTYKAVILSGSPFSVRANDAPHPNLEQIKGKLPLLGVCYGAQYLAHFYGGQVNLSETREYGRANLKYFDTKDPFFKDISKNSQVWMSHADTILTLPKGSKLIGSTEDVINAAYKILDEDTYAIQFHPEVYHTTDGKQILKNFLVDIANVKQNWTPDSFVEMAINEIKEKVCEDVVILGLSGGVDSSVAAMLLNRALGDKLSCIFVNNGLLRKNEYEEVLAQYSGMGLNVKGIDASNKFLNALGGISEPEMKRKIIGKIFIDIFNLEAKKVKGVKWLGQGTIYPDVIESISVNGPSATIKSHHNVGGLPEQMKLKLVEPLRMLFKDEVRRVGKSMNMDPSLLARHPFPGPGLSIRILGEITREKVRILQEVDHIFINGLKKWNLYDDVWQAGAIFLPVNSVGVMGDERTYENCVALRAVQSTDGMTADWVNLPYEFLQKISNEIINNVKGINRVVYDISSKPPATIEWE